MKHPSNLNQPPSPAFKLKPSPRALRWRALLCLPLMALRLSAQSASGLGPEQSTDLQDWQTVTVTPQMLDAAGNDQAVPVDRSFSANASGEAAESLSIGLSEPTINLFQATRYSTKIRAIREGWSGKVRLKVSGLPIGVRGNLGSAIEGEVTLNAGLSQADLSLEVGHAVPPGTWPLTVTATGGNLTATEVITLVVMAPVYRGVAQIGYTNYWNGNPAGNITWDMTTNYEVVVDYTKSPPVLTISGRRLGIASGPGNDSDTMVNVSTSINSKFPVVSASVDAGTTYAKERITVEGSSYGTTLRLDMSVSYIRDQGGGGTLAPWPLFLSRDKVPVLHAKTSPPGSGTLVISPQSANGYPPGTVVSVRAVPGAGQSFTGWRGDASGKTNPLKITMSANKVLTATFAESSPPVLSKLVTTGFALSPSFSSGTTSYVASVANATASVKITPTAAGSATLKVNGVTVASGASSGWIPLVVGDNVIHVVLTNSGGMKNTYKINVTRAPSSGSALSKLVVKGQALSPSFSSDNLKYSLKVKGSTTSVRIKPTAKSMAAKITVAGVAVASDTLSKPIRVKVGNSVIPIVVTAKNGLKVTYEITVTRPSVTSGTSSSSPAFVAAAIGQPDFSKCDSFRTVTSVARVEGAKYLMIEVDKNSGPFMTKPRVEVSPNLIDWYSGNTHTTVLEDSAALLRVRDNTPLSRDSKRHIRVREVEGIR